ncbi:MAG: exosortase [Desulfobacterium sp.]|nr:exosortase [Desulfobacterium sp.]
MIGSLNQYRHYYRLLPAFAGFLFLYNNVIYKMVLDWVSNDNFSHGFLIPIISGYLIWRRKDRLTQASISPSDTGLILLIFSLIFYFIANIGVEQFTMRFSMIMVILSLTVFLAGWECSRILFLPIVYLVFMIPFPSIIWNKIAFPLKLFATQMAVSVIQFFDIPVFGEGNIIHLANTTLEVVDACSGLRSLTSLLALSSALALLTEHSGTKKFFIFLSAIPIAIFLNIIRLTITAILARHYGPDIAQGFLHEASGILIFILSFFFLFAVNLLMSSIGRSVEK